jgi:ribosomal protein S4E
MVTGGRNCGRVGTIVHQEKHKGSFDVIHVRDATGEAHPMLNLSTLALLSCLAAVLQVVSPL